MKNNILILAVAIAAMSCVYKTEYTRVQIQSDSLQAALTISQGTVSLYEQVTAIIDSVENSQLALRVDLENGSTYDDYVSKMSGIKKQLKIANDKMAKLEADAGLNLKYINSLKKQLKQKNTEIQQLNSSIETYKANLQSATDKNTALINMVDVQSQELTTKEEQIEQKKQELLFLEAKIEAMSKESLISQAESTYARAQAIEEIANRTQLAPKKKKESLQEALVLYEKSLSLGNKDAKAKVDELKAKLK
ncbi:MAG: chromosome segregation ATPase [Cyclobacteriaceae bacterium]|jgi:chromosome segregation ATPase